jgi:hypothetical protein
MSELAVDGEASTSESTLPKFPISQSVQDNLLFKTLAIQAQALLTDLDSEPSTAVKPPNAARPPPPRFNMPSLIDEPDE